MKHKYQIRVNQYPLNSHKDKISLQYVWEIYDFVLTDKDNIAHGYAISPILAYAEADNYIQKINILEKIKEDN